MAVASIAVPPDPARDARALAPVRPHRAYLPDRAAQPSANLL
jgi:hypothetical protein